MTGEAGEYEPPPMGSATVEIALDLIAEAIHLPASAWIIGAEMCAFDRVIRLRIMSPDLPGDLDGVTPAITRHAERFEWDWNLPAALSSRKDQADG